MDAGTPTPTTPEPAAPGLQSLRAAATRVAELARPTGSSQDDAADHAFDAAEHAVRFEELHEALAAVLDELDRS